MQAGNITFVALSSLVLPELPWTFHVPANASVADLKLALQLRTNSKLPAICQELFVRPQGGQGDMGVLLDHGHPLSTALDHMGVPHGQGEAVAVFIAVRDFRVHEAIRQALETAVRVAQATRQVSIDQQRRLDAARDAAREDGDPCHEVEEYAAVLAELQVSGGSSTVAEPPAPQNPQPGNTSGVPSPSDGADPWDRVEDADFDHRNGGGASENGTGGKNRMPKRKFVRETGRQWTPAETENLIKGVEMHKIGNWQLVLESRIDGFHHGRTAIDLKDKWRNLCKAVGKPANRTRGFTLSEQQRRRIAACAGIQVYRELGAEAPRRGSPIAAPPAGPDAAATPAS